ncbi:hypothetical protein San01_64830 [Streptomyces angustmyceticus]|uniref:Uncharacterized protein n=1 Tax=Streptomyces angustmyceticus TaxID=285578 RepID=A0A5J4LUB6_9ACTN|nr:hypothetical protein San01_64830 [Streptomyces angustmyceticus]
MLQNPPDEAPRGRAGWQALRTRDPRPCQRTAVARGAASACVCYFLLGYATPVGVRGDSRHRLFAQRPDPARTGGNGQLKEQRWLQCVTKPSWHQTATTASRPRPAGSSR